MSLGIRESPNKVDTGWDLSCVKYGVPISFLRYTSGLHSSISPEPMLPWRKKFLWKTETRTIMMSDHNCGGLFFPLSFESSQNRIRVLGQMTCRFTSGRDQGPRDPLMKAKEVSIRWHYSRRTRHCHLSLYVLWDFLGSVGGRKRSLRGLGPKAPWS